MRSIFLVLAFSLASCGYGPPLDLACQDYACATCARRNDCAGGRLYPRAWADEATCVARLALQCETTFGAPDTHITPLEIEKCAEAVPSASCADIQVANVGSACTFGTGSRKNGEPCVAAQQCQSTFCSGNKDALCGTCAPVPPAGSDCTTQSCARGQICYGVTHQCVVPIAAGGACTTGASLCVSDYLCSAATGQMGTCIAASDEIGANCTGTDAVRCDGSQYLACQGATGVHTCDVQPIAQAGEPCATLANGTYASCEAGSCAVTVNASGVGTGVCIGDVPEGKACDTALGPFCLTPARCVTTSGATSGTCQLPVANGC